MVNESKDCVLLQAYGLFPSYKSLIEQHPDILSRRKGVVELRPSDTVCVVFTSKLTPKMESKVNVTDRCLVK